MKFFYFGVILLVFLATFVSAQPIEINFLSESYSGGETLQAWINVTGDLQGEIKHTDIGLLKEGSGVTVYPYLVKIDDSHYFAYYNVPMGLEEGIYSFVVKDVIYVEGNVLVEDDFSKDFALNNLESVSLMPGVFKVSDVNRDYVFQLFVRNNKASQVDVYFSKTKPYLLLMHDSFSLDSGEEEILEIYFDHHFVEEIENDYINVFDGERNYRVPVWLGFETFENVTNQTNQTEPDNQTNITIPDVEALIEFTNENNELITELDYGRGAEGSLFFTNYGNETVYNITFSFTGNIGEIASLANYYYAYLEGNIFKKNYLKINENGNAEPGVYEGSVRLTYGEKFDDFLVYVSVKEEQVVVNETVEQNVTSNISNYNPGGFVTTQPGEDEEREGSNIWIWIIVIFIVVLAIILFIVFSRKNKKPTFFGQG